MKKALILGLTLLYGCPGGRTPGTDDTPDPVTLTSVTVTPETVTKAISETQGFTATANYSDGSNEDVTTEAVWTSSDVNIATVLSTGVATAVEAGVVKIEATFGEQVGSANMTVTGQPISSIAIDPMPAMLDIGATVQLSATATFEDGSTEDITQSATWTSSLPASASVAAGLVTGVAPGMVDITVEAGGVSTTLSITVNEIAPTMIVVGPEMVNLPIGSTQTFVATATYPDGSSADISGSVQWASSSTVVASIDAAGLATALSVGFTSITATDQASGVAGSVSLRISPAALTQLTVAPAAATIGMGDTQAFTVQGEFTDGASRDLTGSVMWASSDAAIADVGNMGGNAGVASTLAPGTVTISATDVASGLSSDDSGGSAQLTITPAALVSIIVLPNDPSIPFGADQQFTAIGLLSDNSSTDMTSTVTWSSSDIGVATIDNVGLAQSVGQGTTTIAATDPVTGISSDDASQSSVLTVDPPALVSIDVTPAAVAMVVATNQQFTATGNFSDGNQQDLTTAVLWSSTDPSVSINANGLAAAIQNGNAVVSALDQASGISSDDSNGSATVSVSDATLLSIAIQPTTTTAPAGATVGFTAIGTFDNTATADLTEVVTWNSSANNIATIENTGGTRGVAAALTAGVATISAVEPISGVNSTASGGDATLTVDGAVTLQSIAVVPGTTQVDIGDDVPFSAIGTFSDASTFDMTNTVTWSSSNPGLATISNNAGTRGIATGVAVGTLSISALHGPTGIGSTASGGDASLVVEVGIITVNGTYPGPTVSVDAVGQYGTNVGNVAFSTADFPSGQLISDVDVLITFRKTDGSCAAPGPGSAYHGETSFRIQSAQGTLVALAPSNTWSGNTATGDVVVTFDQAAAAAPSGTPVTGTFLPNQTLDTLNGENPVGTWVLQAGDTSSLDPLCVINYTVIVTAQ